MFLGAAGELLNIERSMLHVCDTMCGDAMFEEDALVAFTGGHGSSCSSLKDDVEGENAATSDVGHTTTDEVSQVASDQSIEDGPCGQDGDDERLMHSWDVERSELSPGRVCCRVWKTGEDMDEVFHCHDSVDVARVGGKEDPAERSECAREVRLAAYRFCCQPRAVCRPARTRGFDP